MNTLFQLFHPDSALNNRHIYSNFQICSEEIFPESGSKTWADPDGGQRDPTPPLNFPNTCIWVFAMVNLLALA